MTNYTPTTEEVRDYIRAADRVTAHMFAGSADSVEAFDRWLATPDAEVRQGGDYHEGFEEGLKVGRAEVRTGVVAAEPEWEFGVGWRWNDTVHAFSTGTRDAAEEHIGRHPEDPDFGPHFLVRREPERVAGPWVPVKQEGAEQ